MATSSTEMQISIVAVFALLTLVGIGTLHWMSRDRNKRWLSPTVIKLYGLITVAGFAVMLAESAAEASVKTAGFTVLGTIAGFLAGTSVPDEPSGTATGRANPVNPANQKDE